MVGRRRVDRSRLRSLVVVLIVLVTPAVAAGCLSPKPVPHKAYTVKLPTDQPLPKARSGPFVTTGRGPTVPTSHAWFGAYVGPTTVASADPMTAVNSFETQIGRSLSIVQTFDPWGSTFPTSLDYDIVSGGQIDMVSWAGTDTRSITSGVYDGAIKAFADAVRTFRAPILLRFRWEMDRPNLSASIHSGADYIAAWKHVRAIFTQEDATNAGFVWCPTSTAFANGTAKNYYPGNGQVDWICADLYPDSTLPSFAAMMTPVLAFARKHPRPVLVGEIGLKQPTTPAMQKQTATWLRDVAPVLAAQPQVKALVYFDSLTTTYPPYDYTVDSPSSTLAAFRELVTNKTLSASVAN